MVPPGLEPECFKMSIVLTSEQDINVGNGRDDDVITIDDEDSRG
jgi:hypothetical protein